MKKFNTTFFCILLITMLILTSCSTTRTFKLENITKIELSNDIDGSIVEITEQEQISTLIQPFNDYEFIKDGSKIVKDYNFKLRFYQGDKIITEIIVRNNGNIIFKNNSYIIKDNTIDLGYYGDLLNE